MADETIPKMVWPATCKTITQVYGNRSARYVSGRHTGLDIGCRSGSNVYAAHDGKITFAAWNGVYGREVRVERGSLTTSYHHLSGFAVRKGQSVSAGTVIGFIGSTGQSTGPHLHFEVRINGDHTDPMPFLKGSQVIQAGANQAGLDDVFKIPGAVIDAFKWLSKTENWYRVGLFLLGAIVLLMALVGVAKTQAFGKSAIGTVKKLAKGKVSG